MLLIITILSVQLDMFQYLVRDERNYSSRVGFTFFVCSFVAIAVHKGLQGKQYFEKYKNSSGTVLRRKDA